MAKVKNISAVPNNRITFCIKQGYFGLRINGFMPQALKKMLIHHASYWSAYDVEQYFEDRERKVNIFSLKGWYYSQSAITELINQGYSVSIK